MNGNYNFGDYSRRSRRPFRAATIVVACVDEALWPWNTQTMLCETIRLPPSHGMPLCILHAGWLGLTSVSQVVDFQVSSLMQLILPMRHWRDLPAKCWSNGHHVRKNAHTVGACTLMLKRTAVVEDELCWQAGTVSGDLGGWTAGWQEKSAKLIYCHGGPCM